MPGRNISMLKSCKKYRFSFNGQERDDEITNATGSHNTALFWEYDTRLGRRWNLDSKPQISISDYAGFGNNPIWFNDLLGDTWLKSSDRKEADKTKNSINNKIESVKNEISKKEIKFKNAKTDELKMQYKNDLDRLNEKVDKLQKVIFSLEEMEKDLENTYTFSPVLKDSEFPTCGGFTGEDGKTTPGLVTYDITDGTKSNYEGVKYKAIFYLNYIQYNDNTGDIIRDPAAKRINLSVKAHEIIHGGQIARGDIKVPNNPLIKGGSRFDFNIPDVEKLPNEVQDILSE